MEENNKIIEKFKANPLLFIGLSIGSFVVGQIIESAFGQQIQDFFKNKVWDSTFFIGTGLPFIIGIILPIIAIILLSYILFKPTENTEKPNNPIVIIEPADFNKDEKEFLSVLKDVGIIAATSKLTATQFEPKEVMERTKKHLLFMGILGSKWVNSHGSVFESFLKRIEQKHGEVKFLLIDPEGRAYNKLEILREGAIKEQSLTKLHDLAKTYSCLRVKLYDELPSFRLIFIDEQILAISRYKLDREGHFKSKFGWEAPHVVITSNADWSLFDSFEHQFHAIWDNSKDLEDFISQQIENSK
jgi:hypothetical protein